MKKKLISLLVVTAMVVGCMSGCGSENKKSDSANGAKEGSNEISMMIFEDAAAPFSEDWLSLKMIEENADVKLNIQSVPVSDQATKTQVVFNSGEIPKNIPETKGCFVRSVVASQ